MVSFKLNHWYSLILLFTNTGTIHMAGGEAGGYHVKGGDESREDVEMWDR